MHSTHSASRQDLAAVFRWSSRLGFGEGICNHFSFAVDENHFLVNPLGYHWSELTASSLLLVDDTGTVIEGQGEVEPTALFIHWRIHYSNPLARCVLHTHMPFATAITIVQQGRLEMASQNSVRFFNDIAYDDDYRGLALDTNEGNRICHKLADNRVLFLANHGVIVVSHTIANAFDDLYYLERACQVQVIAQSSGRELKTIDDETARKTCEQFAQDQSFARHHLDAIRRILDRECPEYAK